MENNTVKFSNNYVKISENGIDLTRSRFPYKHIGFEEIRDIKIENRYLIKNRNIVLLFSATAMVVLIVLLFKSGLIPGIFSGDATASFVIIASRFGIAIIVIIFALSFLIYQSFIKSRVMIIKTRKKQYSVRLKELKDDIQVQNLQQFVHQQFSVNS